MVEANPSAPVDPGAAPASQASPPLAAAPPAPVPPAATLPASLRERFSAWLKTIVSPKNGGTSVRETLNELMEERAEAEAPIGENERLLLGNILSLRDRSVSDAMVPRADIVAVEANTPLIDLVEAMTKEGHSRMPVFRETLDDAIGMVHIKDVLAWRGKAEDFSLAKIQRKILFVSPSMRILELLLEMRVTRCHMALVVDEFGGVDGLVTIEDLVEQIVGEIADEHDRPQEPDMVVRPDGSFDADARITIEALEEKLGPILSPEERGSIDTLGGLAVSVAGRVPIRGELITHPSGLEVEVLEADPRRVQRLRLRRKRVLSARRRTAE
ncbi:MAG: HlyC/CorC family transporter [Rhodospirillales bacterium]|nr:HlyC/CorC family transporter [Rhodospirillales bacterium]